MKPLTLTREDLNTPTGRIIILTDEQGALRAVDWEDYESRMLRLLKRHYGQYSICERAGTGSSEPLHALRAYFAGELAACSQLRVETNGTPFQRTVWRELRLIPAGHTISYGALAKRIGRPTAARAVGMANGSNPTPTVVPCHRVIGANASLTGFGGGLDRKRWLLAHEQAVKQRGEGSAHLHSV